jgi:UDP-N-acetylmuramoylalanine--D-glutamate ligase
MKKWVILGAGESGVGAALLGKKLGYQLLVSDAGPIQEKYKIELNNHDIAFEENGHNEAAVLLADEVIKSPGIPDKADIIVKIKNKNIPIISEIEAAARCTDAFIIAITGSNGKTTTTSLIHHILTKSGVKAGLGGNIGYSFARMVAEAQHQVYVLEISSFQLDGCTTFRPNIAILTNITPDHLDRYDYQFDNYIASKFKIIQNQKKEDYFIYNYDDETTQQNLKKYTINAMQLPFSHNTSLAQGAFISNNQLTSITPIQSHQMAINNFQLAGMHNRYNSMAAAITANVMDLRNDKIKEALETMDSIEHRLEYVCKVGGIEFINDSKATNVNSVWFALENAHKKVIWIAGGQDKGNDYSSIEKLVRQKVKAIVCLGTDNRKIDETFASSVDAIVHTTSMKECVEMAYRMARSNEVVLLSPGCASFDLFKNYEDRGRQFKNCIRQL